MDLTGRLDGPPSPGHSNPGRLFRRPGGAGLNTASVTAALGLETSLAGPVGADEEGSTLKREARARGITESLSPVAGRATGSFVSIVAPDGGQVIGLADLSLYEEAEASWFLGNCGAALAAADAWLLTANQNAATLEGLAANAEDRLVAAATVSAAKAGRLSGVLARVDILFANLGEARVLAGLPGADGATLARALASGGARAGLISASDGPVVWWEEGRSGLVLPPPVGAIADVNGAGDALAGTVLAGLARGRDFAQAVALGIAAAQITLALPEPFAPGLDWPQLEAGAAAVAHSPLPE